MPCLRSVSSAGTRAVAPRRCVAPDDVSVGASSTFMACGGLDRLAGLASVLTGYASTCARLLDVGLTRHIPISAGWALAGASALKTRLSGVHPVPAGDAQAIARLIFAWLSGPVAVSSARAEGTRSGFVGPTACCAVLTGYAPERTLRLVVLQVVPAGWACFSMSSSGAEVSCLARVRASVFHASLPGLQAIFPCCAYQWTRGGKRCLPCLQAIPTRWA